MKLTKKQLNQTIENLRNLTKEESLEIIRRDCKPEVKLNYKQKMKVIRDFNKMVKAMSKDEFLAHIRRSI